MEGPSQPKIAQSKAAANVTSENKKVKKAYPQGKSRIEARLERQVMPLTDNVESVPSEYREEDEQSEM